MYGAAAPAPEFPMTATTPDEAPASPDFSRFALSQALLSAITDLGFSTPTPIQDEAIPVALEGRDLIGRARTGSGKTAAFGLPALQRVLEHPERTGVRALLLAPTRELALQVTRALQSYARDVKVKVLPIYGGAPYGPQVKGLRRGAQIVVGTPGRVIDLLDRGPLSLENLELLVLDEADEMLRMGFIDDVDHIFKATPDDRQVMLFSATMPREIRRVAESHLSDPLEIQVESSALTVEHIEQRWLRVPARHKLETLLRVLQSEDRGTTLVFARTRLSCAELADRLNERGQSAAAMHGDLNQGAREHVLARLRAGRLDTVVATDVAARGIDVPHITHVINYDLPGDAQTYAHRIGRTGRAGRAGMAITLVQPAEVRALRTFERRLGTRIPQGQVPSDAAVARRQRGLLRDALTEIVQSTALDEIETWLDEVAEQREVSVATLAAAAIHTMARSRQVDFSATPSDEPPPWARQERRPPRQSGPPPDGPTAELFLPVGRNRGLRAGDVVGALANELGVPGEVIGRITLRDRICFVELPREVAQRVVKQADSVELRGMNVSLSIARPQGRPAAHHHRPGPPHGHRPDRQHQGGHRPWKGRRNKQ